MVGGLAVQRVALRIEFGQPSQRIGGLQQRPVAAVPDARPQRRGLGVQVEHGAEFTEPRAVGGTQDRAATRGQHDAFELRQLREGGLLAVAEARLALDFEDRRDGDAELVLQLVVGIDEALVQAARQLAAERGLARARKPDQKQIAPVQRHRGMRMVDGRIAARRRAHRTEETVSFTMRGVRKMSSSAFSLLLPVCLKR